MASAQEPGDPLGEGWCRILGSEHHIVCEKGLWSWGLTGGSRVGCGFWEAGSSLARVPPAGGQVRPREGAPGVLYPYVPPRCGCPGHLGKCGPEGRGAASQLFSSLDQVWGLPERAEHLRSHTPPPLPEPPPIRGISAGAYTQAKAPVLGGPQSISSG